MATVFGLEIRDEKMASTARRLLQAHLCIMVMYCLFGILQIVQNSVMNSALEELYENSDAEQPARQGPGGGAMQVILSALCALIAPIAVFVCVRYAVLAGNNQGLMQVLCFFDGCCSCCAAAGLCAIAMSIVFLQAVKSILTAVDCECTTTTTMMPGVSSTGEGACHGHSKEECQNAIDSVSGVLSLVMIFQIVSAVLMVCEIAACGFATMKANEGHIALTSGKVFVGTPPPPQGNVVVGQPVVGQPVAAS